MATQSEFESRRRERRRRERLRKKRIRAVIILVALIGIIAIICAMISSNNTDNPPLDENHATEDVQSTDTPLESSELSKSTQILNLPPASEENNLLQIIADSGQSKRCYLTFDDGPTKNITPQILDVLRRYNIKATFFQVGSYIAANPDMARRVYEEGHLIANHSYSHNYNNLYDNEDDFRSEIEKTQELINSISDENAGESFRLMRFPGGSYNSGDHASEKQAYKKTLKNMDFYYIDWNALNGDAEGRTKNAAQLLEYLKKSAEGYNNLIVLMHDASTKQATVDYLSSAIEYLSEKGYTFHRLDDTDYNPQGDEESTEEVSGSNEDGEDGEEE